MAAERQGPSRPTEIPTADPDRYPARDPERLPDGAPATGEVIAPGSAAGPGVYQPGQIYPVTRGTGTPAPYGAPGSGPLSQPAGYVPAAGYPEIARPAEAPRVPEPAGPQFGSGPVVEGSAPALPPPGVRAGRPSERDPAPRPIRHAAPRTGRGSRSHRSQAVTPYRSPGRAFLGAGLEVVVVLAMALVLSLLIKVFLVQAFFIPSPSMTNTLLVGDRVLVSKLTPGVFELHRGDIVVFKDPDHWLPPVVESEQTGPKGWVRSALTYVGLLPQDSGEHLIKRVIGLPGDTVTCCDANGLLQVNSVGIKEPYLYPGDVPSATPFSVTVKPGHLWVMGDHRSVSEDSRAHQAADGGQVPIANVVGKAFLIVWPMDQAGLLHDPDAVFAGVPSRRAGSP